MSNFRWSRRCRWVSPSPRGLFSFPVQTIVHRHARLLHVMGLDRAFTTSKSLFSHGAYHNGVYWHPHLSPQGGTTMSNFKAIAAASIGLADSPEESFPSLLSTLVQRDPRAFRRMPFDQRLHNLQGTLLARQTIASAFSQTPPCANARTTLTFPSSQSDA